VLRIVARRLNGGSRAGDLVSRLGGDEFACLLAGVSSRAHLQLLVRNLFKVLLSPFKIGSLLLRVRPSIGVAMFPVDGTTSPDLLRNADVAMYLAKRRKSGVAFFDERPTRGPLLPPEVSIRMTQGAPSVSSRVEAWTSRLESRTARVSADVAPPRQPPASGPVAHEGTAFDH
jgi:GGDEF domain-containing protein